jgi:hypothetical protein
MGSDGFGCVEGGDGSRKFKGLVKKRDFLSFS